MADHLHKQIRSALVTALTGLTTSGARVDANRLYPMDSAHLPGLRIFLDGEEAEILTVHGPAVYDRRLALSVECCASAVSGLDDTLDLMSKEVEIALASGITVAGRNLPITYAGMAFEDLPGDKPAGVKRLTFSLPFAAAANAPDTLV